jgi:hypothetical protein
MPSQPAHIHFEPLLKIILFVMVCGMMTQESSAQDTLPNFRAVIRSGRVVLSWVNLSPRVVQLTIQRSSDSLKGFKSIAPMPDPALLENGFMDNRAPDTRQFYRIYVQESGGYFFTTPSRRAIPESEAAPIVRASPIYVQPAQKPTPITPPSKETEQLIPTYNDMKRSGLKPVMARWPTGRIRFSDQLLTADYRVLDVKIPSALLNPSVFMFINPDGNVLLVLPETKLSGFRIQFYLPDGAPFFQISRLKESSLVIDKANFLRSGWFDFEVYEHEMLRERKRIFIPKSRL